MMWSHHAKRSVIGRNVGINYLKLLSRAITNWYVVNFVQRNRAKNRILPQLPSSIIVHSHQRFRTSHVDIKINRCGCLGAECGGLGAAQQKDLQLETSSRWSSVCLTR